MINVKTLQCLHAALLECVPGRAQRHRLLKTLSRVPGNKTVTSVIDWLSAKEDEVSTQSVHHKSSAFRAKLINYTQSVAEVSVTMPKSTAETLIRVLEHASHQHQLTTQLVRALQTVVVQDGKHGQ